MSMSLFQEKLSFQKWKINKLADNNTYLEINLKNLASNLNFLRSKIKSTTKLLAVTKANGYGSDSIEVSKFLENKVDYFAVAYTSEGVELRKNKIKSPILILHPQIGDFDTIQEYNLEPSIYSFKILNEYIDKQCNIPVHIKFNTGLNRLGFSKKNLSELCRILLDEKISVKYILSHLAASEDIKEKSFTKKQIEKFLSISDEFEDLTNKAVKKHLLNTSGILNYSDYQFDMVRSGIGLYGYGNDKQYESKLKPVHSLYSSISQIHEVKKGESVGYNRAFLANKNCRIGIVPIGHADGISRSIGNRKGKVLVNNSLCDIIGNVCMDMIMIELNDEKIKEGDKVILFDENSQNSEKFAEYSNTISYEVLTSISRRIKRKFII